MRFSARLYASPMSTVACVASSPLPNPNTTPLAMTTGSAWLMLREIQAGASTSPSSFSWTLNAAIAPFTT